jgi:hypothetical protein
MSESPWVGRRRLSPCSSMPTACAARNARLGAVDDLRPSASAYPASERCSKACAAWSCKTASGAAAERLAIRTRGVARRGDARLQAEVDISPSRWRRHHRIRTAKVGVEVRIPSPASDLPKIKGTYTARLFSAWAFRFALVSTWCPLVRRIGGTCEQGQDVCVWPASLIVMGDWLSCARR